MDDYTYEKTIQNFDDFQYKLAEIIQTNLLKKLKSNSIKPTMVTLVLSKNTAPKSRWINRGSLNKKLMDKYS